MSEPLLQVENLDLRFATPDGEVRAIDGLSFELARGQTLGIVGESGSGKSQTALAIMGLLAGNATLSGSIRFDGVELPALSERERNALRGSRMAMIFQDPMTSLNPYLRVGTQMGEVLSRHRGMAQAQARAESARMLDAVRMSDAPARLRQYPHELSGGQRQRVMIAMALLCQPQLLIADEPTTALDVTVQAQILALLAQLRLDFKLALLLITHDFGVVAQVCDQTLVMYAGRCMEYAPTAQLLAQPRHPYTRGLLDARPRLDQPLQERLTTIAGVPAAGGVAQGCPFEPRCTRREARCAAEAPLPQARAQGVYSCHAPLP